MFLFVVAVTLTFGGGTHAESPGQSSNLLIQVQTIPLNDVDGRIDHFKIDGKGKQLFVAALGNDTVEVVDLAAGRVTRHIRNLRAPQGIGFSPESNRLAVANDKNGSCRLYDGTSLQQTATIELKDDADNVRYDAVSRLFWVGYDTWELLGQLPLGRGDLDQLENPWSRKWKVETVADADNYQLAHSKCLSREGYLPR